MLNNKENIVVIEEWTLSDLYDKGFWSEVFSTINSNRSIIESKIGLLETNNSSSPIILEKKRKDQMIDFLWETLPTEYKISFFEQDYTVYYIWASSIAIDNFIKFHDLLVKREIKKVPDFISSTRVYQKMVESRNKAFEDMGNTPDTKDVVLMKFYDKLKEEEVISLNTPEYILVSGTDDEKIQGLNDQLLEEKYVLLYTMDYTNGSELIPIYVFNPPKEKKN